MIDISKIYLAQTPEEFFALTNTTNFTDAENISKEALDQSYSTVKSVIYRIVFVCIGLFFLFLILVIPPLIVPLFLFSFFFLGIAFFGKIFAKKRLRGKIGELKALAKKIEDYPELIIGKNVGDSFPKSVLGSHSISVNDTGGMFVNTDKTKHLWNCAGLCSVDTGRTVNDGKTVVWQDYYVFVYSFQGSVPQVLLLNKQDQFLPLSNPNNKIIADDSFPWHCIIPDQYEIEVLAILTEGTVLKLIEESSHGPVCTFELLNSQLLCFIPVDSVNIKELFFYEKTADTFANILLPQLEKATMTTIGFFSPVLSIDSSEEGNHYIELSESEKKREKWMPLIAGSFLLL